MPVNSRFLVVNAIDTISSCVDFLAGCISFDEFDKQLSQLRSERGRHFEILQAQWPGRFDLILQSDLEAGKIDKEEFSKRWRALFWDSSWHASLDSSLDNLYSMVYEQALVIDSVDFDLKEARSAICVAVREILVSIKNIQENVP